LGSSLQRTFGPVSVVVEEISSTMTWQLTKGRARQFIVTNENRRCSIPAFAGTSLVPFARSRREVVNFDVEAEFVGEALQLEFPQANP
jgi:hypothetical protein